MSEAKEVVETLEEAAMCSRDGGLNTVETIAVKES